MTSLSTQSTNMDGTGALGVTGSKGPAVGAHVLRAIGLDMVSRLTWVAANNKGSGDWRLGSPG